MPNYKLPLIIFLGYLGSTVHADTLRTVVMRGDPAPNNPQSSFFGSVNLPSINSSGQVTFLEKHAFVSGVWAEDEYNSPQLIAFSNLPAPGTESGVSFDDLLFKPVLNDQGQTAFMAYLDLPGSSGFRESIGIWSQDLSEHLTLVVRDGVDAPGEQNGVVFSNWQAVTIPIAFNNNHQTAFRARLSGPGVTNDNDDGLWLETASQQLMLVAREDDVAPGTNNEKFNSSFNVPRLNDSGQLAFTARTDGGDGIWGLRNGIQLEKIVFEGDPAPGFESGVTIGERFLYGPTINGYGHTAFFASLNGTGINSGNEGVLWSEAGGNGLDIVARTGEVAPGTEEGTVFNSFGDAFLGRPALNDVGETAFKAALRGPSIDGTNGFGIWSGEDPNSLRLVVRTGESAPGTPDGVRFDRFSNNLVLNETGQVAFTAFLNGPGMSINTRGLWAEDQLGQLQLVAYESGTLEVGPGDVRTIRDISFVGNAGNGEGHPTGFNDSGQIVFWAQFTDFSEGIFVSSALSVPEPSTLVLSFGLACITFKRKRNAEILKGPTKN